MTVDTDSIAGQLLELQTIDQKIQETRDRIGSFDPLLAEVEEPALVLEKDLTTLTGRVQELKLDERRLGLAVDEKQARVDRLEDRLNQVRNVREEAAVQAELGLVRRALESEEQEVVSLLDQISRFDERLADLKAAVEEAQAAVEPRRNELLAEREKAHADLAALELTRDQFAADIDERYRKVYDNLIRGGRLVAVAPMTEDGACGACFSLIPLQIQNEIRTSAPLVLCEACGVIVTPPVPEPEPDAETPAASADTAADEEE